MNSHLPRVVLGGIFGGALFGFLIGEYLIVLTKGHVIRRDDFAHDLPFEQTESRYVFTVLSAFVVVFAAIGPVVASASIGGWIGHAVYGLVSAIAIIVSVTVIAAAITDQQPVNMTKGSPSTYIDIARTYAVPVAIIVGPVTGILIGRLFGRRNLGCTPSEEAS